MKFYYNGKLVRTSKNHEYTHAVIDITNNACVGCRVGADKAEAIIRGEISATERSIANCKTAIKALENGKSGFHAKEGRGRTWYHKFTTSDTVEKYNRSIEQLKGYIDRINATWQVVELEARA